MAVSPREDTVMVVGVQVIIQTNLVELSGVSQYCPFQIIISTALWIKNSTLFMPIFSVNDAQFCCGLLAAGSEIK